MTTLRKAAEQALEALIRASCFYDTYDEIVALCAALAHEPQTTHSEECWRWHHDCAVAEVERLRAVAKHGD